MSELRLEAVEQKRKIARLEFIFMLHHDGFSADPDAYVSSFLLHFRVPHNMLLKPYICKTLQYQKSFFPRIVDLDKNFVLKVVYHSQCVYERILYDYFIPLL